MPVTEYVYLSLIKLYEKYSDHGLRGRILQCLGMYHVDSYRDHV